MMTTDTTYRYIIGIHIMTRFGAGVILQVYEFPDGQILFYVDGGYWKDWITEADIIEEGQ